MTGTFTVEQLRPIKDGMTISRDAKIGQTTAVTFFSLGKDTSISQERYDVTSIYIGAKGTADFLIGDQAKKEPVSDGDCLIVPGGTLCGVETTTGTVYTEIIIKKETTMNSIVKSGEVMKLKDKKLKTLYREAIDKICNDYTIGEAKTGDLSGFYGYDIYYNKTNYELAYTIERVGEELVVVVMAGTRENFYDQLKRYIKG